MMGVYIRGMEMPKHCGECGVEWCDRWKKLIIAGMSIAKSRPSDCPLVPVPEHGDLIDRAVFREDMDKHYPFDRYTQSQHGWEDEAKTTIIQMLAAAPIIIPASEEGET